MEKTITALYKNYGHNSYCFSDYIVVYGKGELVNDRKQSIDNNNNDHQYSTHGIFPWGVHMFAHNSKAKYFNVYTTEINV